MGVKPRVAQLLEKNAVLTEWGNAVIKDKEVAKAFIWDVNRFNFEYRRNAQELKDLDAATNVAIATLTQLVA